MITKFLDKWFKRKQRETQRLEAKKARDKECYQEHIENIFEKYKNKGAIKGLTLKNVELDYYNGQLDSVEIEYLDDMWDRQYPDHIFSTTIPIDYFKEDKFILDFIGTDRFTRNESILKDTRNKEIIKIVKAAFKNYAQRYPGLDIEIDEINYRHFRPGDEKTTVKFTVNCNIPIEITLLPAEMREPQIIKAIINAIDETSRPYLYHEDLIKRINDIKPKIKGGQL